MPLTDPRSIIVRGTLQNVSLKYSNTNYVADQIFPIIDGVNRQAKVTKYYKGPWFRDEAGPRAPGTKAPLVQMSVTSVNLDPINNSAATMVTDEERQNASVPGNLVIQPDIDAMELIADKLDLKRERRCAAMLHATNWSAVGAGGEDAEGHWGDGTAANDTFLADINNAKTTILSNTGLLPNSLFLDWYCWKDLELAPALLALMNPVQLGKNALVTIEALKSLIGIPNIVLGTAVYSTDEETAPDSSFTSSPVWGTAAAPTKGVAFLYYKPPKPGLRIASAGYQYRVRLNNGSVRQSTTWRENAIHSDMYDTEEEIDIAAVGTDLGYMWKDTATT